MKFLTKVCFFITRKSLKLSWFVSKSLAKFLVAFRLPIMVLCTLWALILGYHTITGYGLLSSVTMFFTHLVGEWL